MLIASKVCLRITMLACKKYRKKKDEMVARTTVTSGYLSLFFSFTKMIKAGMETYGRKKNQCVNMSIKILEENLTIRGIQ